MSTVIDFFKDLPKMINQIKNLIIGFFQFITSIFDFLPAPFGQILMVVSVILVVIILIKIVGGLL